MAAVRKLSQLELIDNYISQIQEHFDDTERSYPPIGLYRLMSVLVGVLDKAQDNRPKGASDGTIGIDRWKEAQRVAQAVRELQLACDGWRV